MLTHTIASPFFTGPLRSPSRLQNTFAHECLLDEIAAQVKADPVAYRLRHLSDPRLKDVVSEAAKAASWQPRPSPKPGAVANRRRVRAAAWPASSTKATTDTSRSSRRSTVNTATGKVVAQAVSIVAQDCGPVSNPDGMRNQLEGGALQGLSRALGEEVTWDDAEGDVDRLADVSQPDAGRRDARRSRAS